MKKQTLFLALLFALALAGRGQDESLFGNSYHPITDGCSWSVSNDKYMAAGDTVLGSKIYLKIYRQSDNQSFDFNLSQAQYFASIRNDSDGMKTYGFLPAGSTIKDLNTSIVYQLDTAQEILLYDFSLEKGDTVTYYALGNNNHAVKCTAIRVESADIPVGWNQYSPVFHHYSSDDTIVYLTDNTPLRQILLTSVGYPVPNNVWIEGIGSIHGFAEGDPLWFEDVSRQILLCFSDNSEATYQTGFDFDNSPEDCFSNGFGGDVTDRPPMVVSLYPNPVSDVLHISSSSDELRYALYSILGKPLRQGILSPDQSITINMSGLPCGIYMLHYTTNGVQRTRKIIKY